MKICAFIRFSPLVRFISLITLLAPALAGSAQTPVWIWPHAAGSSIKTNETRYFRKEFEIPAKPGKSFLSVAAEGDAIVFINGKEVVKARGSNAAYDEVGKSLRKGRNV